MQTVKKYFSDDSTNIIFSHVSNAISQFVGFSVTPQVIRHSLIERFGNQYINGEPTLQGFSNAVDYWLRSRQQYFLKLKETTEFEYNPIHNVDETTTETTKTTPNLTTTRNATDTDTDTRTETKTYNTTDSLQHGKTTTSSSNVTGNNDVTTYNDSTFLNDTRSTQTGNDTITDSGTDTSRKTGNDTTERGGNYTKTISETETNSGNTETQFNRNRAGNIGITTTQQLIREQREIINIDLYQVFIERFAERFFIPIFEMESDF